MILKFSAEPTPRPPETTRCALCRSGRSLLALLPVRRSACASAASRRRVSASTGALPPRAGFRPRRGAHGGDHGVAGRRLDGDDRVAGVDRALERVRAFDRHHVGHLRARRAARRRTASGPCRRWCEGRTRACSRRRASATCGASTCASACAFAALATASTRDDAVDLRGFARRRRPDRPRARRRRSLRRFSACAADDALARWRH